MAQTGNASHRGHNAPGSGRASEFDRRVLHTHMAFDFALPLPTSSVRLETSQIAQPKKKK